MILAGYIDLLLYTVVWSLWCIIRDSKTAQSDRVPARETCGGCLITGVAVELNSVRAGPRRLAEAATPAHFDTSELGRTALRSPREVCPECVTAYSKLVYVSCVQIKKYAFIRRKFRVFAIPNNTSSLSKWVELVTSVQFSSPRGNTTSHHNRCTLGFASVSCPRP
ncbi:hypothetical protein BKA82DRAFT_2120826 [Pisolithus tinctorius]|nr:hypothetical protein BKA82DRAFT_2120826 [Pisolithus tinctorius]